jgi:hypothetical protein
MHMDDNQNPYEILGISEAASTAEIKRRYRQRARELHPDTGEKPNPAQFAKITRAYNRVNTHEKRRTWADKRLQEAEKAATARAAQEHLDKINANKEARLRARREAKIREERIRNQAGGSKTGATAFSTEGGPRPPRRSPPPSPQPKPPLHPSPPLGPMPPSEGPTHVRLELARFVLVVLATVASSGILAALVSAGDLNHPDFGVVVVRDVCVMGCLIGLGATVFMFLRLSVRAQGIVFILCLSLLVGGHLFLT